MTSSVSPACAGTIQSANRNWVQREPRQAGQPVRLAKVDVAEFLSCYDREALERFTVRTLTDYADLKIVRRPIEERLLRPEGT
jgi:hypothetical protein